MLKTLAYSTALGLILSSGAFAQDHDHDNAQSDGDVTLYRVFVGDHEAGQVTAFDLDEPETHWTFETTGQSKLYSVARGATIAAVQSDDDVVHFITSGINLHDHGDHADIEIIEPAAVETVLSGPRPFHLVDHDGKVIINYDKGGYAEVLEGHQLSEGQVDVIKFPQARAHHGFLAALSGHWLSSIASDAAVEGDAAPPRLGLQEFTQAGEPIGDLATCTAIHGEAFSGAYLATGCEEGILTATVKGDAVTFDMLEYPADLPQGMTTGTLLGSTGMQAFLGNYGPDGLVVVDPADEPHFRFVKLPFRRVDFVLDPGNARYGYVLIEDGTLHQVDLLAAEVTASARVTEPYSMDGHWNDPRPRLAMAGGEVVMSDPNAGLVRRIDKETLEEVGTVDVEGTPYNIAVAGGSGIVHGAGGDDHDHDEHAHADDHAHGHDHDSKVYQGYFQDDQVAARELSDWAGDWQSVYPLLEDGTLDPVMEQKAQHGDQSAQDYRAYYETGYRTDVDRITIDGDTVTFYEHEEPIQARYESDGFEILTYAKGNRGVRFIFQKVEGDDAAPQFLQFSDHAIAPQVADHYHLYWGDDRAALLQEMDNWPTYYPASLSANEIVDEMIAH